jgi:hypothetical protein
MTDWLVLTAAPPAAPSTAGARLAGAQGHGMRDLTRPGRPAARERFGRERPVGDRSGHRRGRGCLDGGGIAAGEAPPGIETLGRGLQAQHGDDDALRVAAHAPFDTLYAALRQWVE